MKKNKPNTATFGEFRKRQEFGDYFRLTLIAAGGVVLVLSAFFFTLAQDYRIDFNTFQRRVAVSKEFSKSAIESKILEVRMAHAVMISNSSHSDSHVPTGSCWIHASVNPGAHGTWKPTGNPDPFCAGFNLGDLFIRHESDFAKSELLSRVSVYPVVDNANTQSIAIVHSLKSPRERVSLLILKESEIFLKNQASIIHAQVVVPGAAEFPIEKEERAEVKNRFETTRDLNIAQNSIRFRYWDPGNLSPAYRSWIVLLTGLLVVGFVSTLFFMMVNSSISIREEVAQKSASLILATEEAIRANSAKSEFLANMSHELRTPLNLILGTAELMNESELKSLQRHYVQTFKKAGRYLLDLINDLLDFPRVEAGEVQIIERDFDLVELIGDVSDTVATSCIRKRLEYFHYVDLEVPKTVRSDPRRIRQILLNLLTNGVRYTERGHVSLEVLLSSNVEYQGMVEFRITDTGMGIPPEDFDKIFSRNFRGAESQLRTSSGFGLGLSIVHDFVGKLNGKIKFKSEQNIGTTFQVFLPLQDVTRTNWVDNARTSYSRLSNQTVMVAADFGTKTQYLSDTLSKFFKSVNIVALTTTQESVEALYRSQSVDQWIIVLSAKGESVDAHLRVLEAVPSECRKRTTLVLPIGIWAGDISHVEALGFSRLLTCPIRIEQLLKALDSAPGNGPVEQPKEVLVPRSSKFPILFVDDDVETQSLVRSYLSDLSVDLTFASDGQEALEIFQASPNLFKLVLTDLRMPRMGGLTLIQKLKELENTLVKRLPPIVILTADAREDKLSESLRAGATSFLTKPFSRNDLIGCITEIRSRTFGQQRETAKDIV